MYFACAWKVALDWQGIELGRQHLGTWALRSGVIRAAIGQGQKAERVRAGGVRFNALVLATSLHGRRFSSRFDGWESLAYRPRSGLVACGLL